MRQLKREGKDSSGAQRDFFNLLRHYHKVQHTTYNKSAHDAVWEKKRFLQDPNSFAKNLFNPPNAGKPTFTKDVAEDYFKNTYHDSDRNFSV